MNSKFDLNNENNKEITKNNANKNAKKYYNKSQIVPIKEINLIGFNYELIVAAQPMINRKASNENNAFPPQIVKSASNKGRSASVTPSMENNRYKYLTAKLLRKLKISHFSLFFH